MPGLIPLLAIIALILTICSAASGKVPLWIAVLLLCVIVLFQVWK